MKIKRLALVALVLSTFAVSACGSSSNSNVVTFWISGGNAVTDLFKGENGLIKKFKEKFKDQLPSDFDINIVPYGNYDSLYDAVSKAIPAGTTPTMAVAYPDNAASYVRSNSLIDINTFLNDPDTAFTAEEGGGSEDFVKAFWDEGKNISNKDGLYTVPLYKSTEVMIFNRSYFAEHNLQIPTTWDELMSVAQQIYDDNPEKWSAEDCSPVIWDSDSNLFITHAYQNDIPYTDPSNQDNPFVFNNEANRSFVKELKEYHDKGLIETKGSLGGTTYSSSYLTAEKCIIAIGSTGGSSYNITSNFQVGIAPEPVFNKENPKYIQQGPDVCFFRRSSSSSTHWAWEFYKFLTSTGTNLELTTNLSYSPVRYSCYENDAYKEYVGEFADYVDHPLEKDDKGNLKYQNENNMGLVQMAAYQTQKIVQNDQLFYSPAFPGSAEARGDQSSGVGNVIAGTLSYKGKDIDAQIEKLMSTAVSAALQAYTDK